VVIKKNHKLEAEQTAHILGAKAVKDLLKRTF
jgi:hypothetical protein